MAPTTSNNSQDSKNWHNNCKIEFENVSLWSDDVEDDTVHGEDEVQDRTEKTDTLQCLHRR